MKTYDRVKLSAEGLLRWDRPNARLDWKKRRGFILGLRKDGLRAEVVWDGCVSEQPYLLTELTAE